MTDHCPIFCLILLAICLLTAGCQETRAPAASNAPGNRTSDSSDRNVPDKSNPSSVPAATAGENVEQDSGESKLATKPVAKPDPPAETRDYSFDDLKFDIEKGGDFKREMLTDKIEAMVDTPIRIRGYILPSFQQTGLKQFVLVRDNMECCFGPGAALFDCILVEMSEGKSTSFSVRPVAVEGKFTINEFIGPDGKHLAIYHLRGEAVKQ